MTNNDRKFPSFLENPIDNYIIHFGKNMFPIYKRLDLTPNILTTISLVFGLLSIYLFYNKKFIFFFK